MDKFNEKFTEEFRNKSVTISVQEMADIIATKMSDICDKILEDSDAELEDLIYSASILVILNRFGADIMYEMFENLTDLEIEKNDGNK